MIIHNVVIFTSHFVIVLHAPWSFLPLCHQVTVLIYVVWQYIPMTFSLAVALISAAWFLPTTLMSPLSSIVNDSIINVDTTSPFDGFVSILMRSDGSSCVSPLNLHHAQFAHTLNVLHLNFTTSSHNVTKIYSQTVETDRSHISWPCHILNRIPTRNSSMRRFRKRRAFCLRTVRLLQKPQLIAHANRRYAAYRSYARSAIIRGHL